MHDVYNYRQEKLLEKLEYQGRFKCLNNKLAGHVRLQRSIFNGNRKTLHVNVSLSRKLYVGLTGKLQMHFFPYIIYE